MTPDQLPSEVREATKPEIRAPDIFLAFTQISLSGFGGVMFWARYVLVERRRWLTEREFVETLAMGQILPGPNIFNLGVMIGYRFAGYVNPLWLIGAGALAGMAGLA